MSEKDVRGSVSTKQFVHIDIHIQQSVITDEAKDIFRDTGGLQSVLDTVTSTRYGEVTEAGLYCLGSAVERNGRIYR